MICKICSTESSSWFKERIMQSHLVEYFYCKNCGFLQTEEPYWLEEVYKDPVSIFDTGAAARNILVARKLTTLLFFMFYGKGAYVDYAGGFGLLTRLMRDAGFDYYWTDRYADNMFSRGFSLKKLGENEKLTAVTSIECFEHLPDPLSSISEMFSISDTLIFTTEIMMEPPPEPSDWWYYTFSRGGHISFYSKRTLDYLACLFNVKYYKVGFFHIFSRKPISKFFIFFLRVAVKLNIGFYLSRMILTSKTYSDYNHIQSRCIDGRKD